MLKPQPLSELADNLSSAWYEDRQACQAGDLEHLLEGRMDLRFPALQLPVEHHDPDPGVRVRHHMLRVHEARFFSDHEEHGVALHQPASKRFYGSPLLMPRERDLLTL